MLYSISIQAHPKRKQFVTELQRTLARPEQSRIPVAWSHHIQGNAKYPKDCWPTHARARAMYDHSARYHLVLQDDALPCPNFHTHLTQMLQETDRVNEGRTIFYSLFYMHRPTFAPANHVTLKAKAGYSNGGFFIGGTHWAQSIITTTKCIPELLAICNALRLDTGDPDDDDRHITAYMQAKQYKCWYPLPSLVDHNPACDSLVFSHMDGANERREREGGCPNSLRQAWKFLGVRA